MFWEPPVDEYLKDQEKKLIAPRVIPKDMNGAWVPMLFPGIGLAGSEEGWNIFIIEPLGPELTRISNRGRVSGSSGWEFAKQSMKSSNFWTKFGLSGKYEAHDAMSDDDPMVAGDFTGEDIYACEQQQKSFQSPYFETGPAAAGESPVIEHQKIVLEWLGEDKPK